LPVLILSGYSAIMQQATGLGFLSLALLALGLLLRPAR
jgi:hypothetical protein